jgi:hypothetical protein
MGAPRVLLLFPGINTFAQSFTYGFRQNNCEVLYYDVGREINSWQSRIHNHVTKLPFSLRTKWYNYFVNRMNEKQMEQFRNFQPQLVVVYNGMFLYPETVRAMQKTARVCFFLGDSPFFTSQNDYYLPSLMEVDYILSPDSYWEKQLRGLGCKNVLYFLIGSNPEVNYKKQVTSNEKAQWGSDLVFAGITYLTSVGFKRALFLHQFTDLDIKIYTSTNFQRWYRYFPDLEKRVVHPEKRLSDDELNTIINCCKIYPVDANPGILNGVHLRIFDCIAGGILPLAEYRKDVKTVFGPAGLPIIEQYGKGADLARYYLQHEDERVEIIDNLRQFTEEYYTPQKAIARLLDTIRL